MARPGGDLGAGRKERAMDYWQKRKLRNWIIIGVLILAAILGIREMLKVHAHSVTVKYIENMEAYRSNQGYTWAVASSDQKVVAEWVKMMEEIKRKGDKVEPAVLDQPFPCYLVEFRFKKGAWIAMMQVTEKQVGYARQFIGDHVFAFDEGESFFQRVGELIEKTEMD